MHGLEMGIGGGGGGGGGGSRERERESEREREREKSTFISAILNDFIHNSNDHIYKITLTVHAQSGIGTF